MKQGRTLQELAVELKRQETTKRDFIVPSAMMELSERSRFILKKADEFEDFGMTEHFHTQLATSLDIPQKYYNRMQHDMPSLLRENVNTWLSNRNTRHTIRTLDGDARAFLSDRYRRIDNMMIMNNLLPIVSEIPEVRIESCEVTEKRLYIKAISPRMEGEVKKDDIVQAGIMISNSEVGAGAVQIMPLLYRCVCNNGLIINMMGHKQFHLGKNTDVNWEMFSDETMMADNQALMLKLADIVRFAVDETRFHLVIDKLKATTEAKITAPVKQIVELTSKEYDFSASESDNILEHLIRGGDMTLWGLTNAVTRAAHDVESYDRSTEMERVGWEVASMPASSWKRMNAG